MSQPLDLSIVFTQPPQDCPAEVIASVTFQCDALGLSHSGYLLTNPLSQPERDDLLWYLEEYWKWPYLEFAARGGQVEELLHELGKRLYQGVFGGVEAKEIIEHWRKQPLVQHQISIVSELPQVLSLPWELLHDTHGFLALRPARPISIVRRLPQPEQPAVLASFEPPLRVLVVTARPKGAGFIDPRGIARELVDEVQAQVEAGTIELEFLRSPTLSALRARLRDGGHPPIHLLHFDGHGMFNNEEADAQGVLAFETAAGRLSLVKAKDLAGVLRDSGVQLVVLTACQSAMSAPDDPLSSVSAQLIYSGMGAVVAMSLSFLVASATRYVEAFYHALSTGTPILTAQERARQALYSDPRRHISRRRGDEEGKPIMMRDWWLPHFYQQGSLVLQPLLGKKAQARKQPQRLSPLHRLNEGMPAEPRYSFSGRARELLQLERLLLSGKLVVIFGFGGVGKTALTREAADWLTRTKMYDEACFVSFEQGGDAAMLLSVLGTYQGIYDGHYSPNDPRKALEKLKPILKERRILLIADNLESILPKGEAALDEAARIQLWDVLLELSAMGAGVLLTSRDRAFGDERLTQRARVTHLELKGLRPQDAYLLASHLLDDLDIDRARAPYIEMYETLAQLDHHPLAIQLVLPALRELPLSQIKSDFAALLPTFTDDRASGRNRSLLASLEYSLRSLSEEQRSLVSRLAPFEGGASEARLLAITQIAEAEWAKLRPALEQAALLRAEQVHEDIIVPFLHFHPVLTPYLRNRFQADDEALRERYIQYYYELANYLFFEDEHNPEPVRALVRRELPNLRRALELLLKTGELEDAARIADYIARFLYLFGLEREHHRLRQQVAEAVVAASGNEGQVLTFAEWMRESGLGEDELNKGDVRAAYARFTTLLARLDAQPADAAQGRGSYEYCVTLAHLARCLRPAGQPVVAESRLREALAIVDELIHQQPENQVFMRHRGSLLVDLGDVLRDQGYYARAQNLYEEAHTLFINLEDLRSQAAVLVQLGILALLQQDYSEARSHHRAALTLFRTLREPAMEATAWHQLGRIAEEEEAWAEAEQCYRESLAIKEQLGNEIGASITCAQLGMVARGAGRFSEAEGWFKRALEIAERVHRNGPEHAGHLNNLAALLVDEVREVHEQLSRLGEARSYAEGALAIQETLQESAEIWTTLGNLANIASLEGQPQVAQSYRCRAHQTYAAFPGNRQQIDDAFGEFISAVASAAKGDMQARAVVEASLPPLEEAGWHITTALQRVLAGERDLFILTDELDNQEALLVLRVLEILE